jgi:hypothetical protein
MTSWNPILTEQLEWHWTNQLRPRLDGLTDDEYLWEPVPSTWNVRPRGEHSSEIAHGSGDFTIDFDFPEPTPTPVTTIAWRLGHIIVGIFGARVHNHFGGPAVDYETFEYAGTAQGALRQLDEGYAAWLAGVRTWSDADLGEPCGPTEAPWDQFSRATLVLHINREIIHHGAEIALLRDLFAHRSV